MVFERDQKVRVEKVRKRETEMKLTLIQPTETEPLMINIQNCDRCGHDHIELPLTKFRRKIITFFATDTKSHFTHCPETKEPMLFNLKED